MSYILDALKKAEKEHELNQFTKWEGHFFPRFLSRCRKHAWFITLTIVLGLNLILWIMLLWPKAPLPPPIIKFDSEPATTRYSSTPL